MPPAVPPRPSSAWAADADAADFVAAPRMRRSPEVEDPDAYLELTGEVSAVVGSPTAGAPRSALGAVSAQHRRAEFDDDIDDAPTAIVSRARLDDDLDQTVISRRSVRPTWELVPESGSPIALTASVVILGRKPSFDPDFPGAQLLALPGNPPTVSKSHARIEQQGDAWIVTDLGSTNGVLVRTLMGDEVEVEQGSQLDGGERFFLGDEEFHLRRIAP